MSLLAHSILRRAARGYKDQQQTFSRKEIELSMQEIKHLSSQRQIPKLSLQKKIVHLDHKMQALFSLEQQMNEHKKHDSVRVAALKRQITILRNKLTHAEDKTLHKKVDKLNHLLGTHQAKRVNARKAKKETYKPVTIKVPVMNVESKLTLEEIGKVQALFHRLNAAKQELQFNEQANETGDFSKLQNEISLLEKKLREYTDKHPEVLGTQERIEPITEAPVIIKNDVKHTVLFEPVKHSDTLPLPPPPKMSINLEA